MIRHQKKERRRKPGLNTVSWKSNKSIEDVYQILAGEVQEPEFPFQQFTYDEGEEAIFSFNQRDFQINVHEYSNGWKESDIDFIYFGDLDEQVNNEIGYYKEII